MKGKKRRRIRKAFNDGREVEEGFQNNKNSKNTDNTNNEQVDTEEVNTDTLWTSFKKYLVMKEKVIVVVQETLG